MLSSFRKERLRNRIRQYLEGNESLKWNKALPENKLKLLSEILFGSRDEIMDELFKKEEDRIRLNLYEYSIRAVVAGFSLIGLLVAFTVIALLCSGVIPAIFPPIWFCTCIGIPSLIGLLTPVFWRQPSEDIIEDRIKNDQDVKELQDLKEYIESECVEEIKISQGLNGDSVSAESEASRIYTGNSFFPSASTPSAPVASNTSDHYNLTQ